MDAASFERVYDSLQEFHAFFAASSAASSGGITAGITFRRCWCRTRSGATPRISRNRWASRPWAMQRFLTEARWSDETVIGRLQEYLAPRLGHPEAVWGFDGSDFPKHPSLWAGNRREWPGSTAAGWARWPTARVGCSWPTSARWAGRWWTSGCICPRVGPPTRTGVLRRVCRRTGGTTGQRRSWPWRCWSGSWSWATSGPSGLPETTPSGCRRPSGRGLAALGMRYVLDVPGGTTVWPLDPAWTSPEYPGFGRPRKPKLRPGQRRTMEQRGDELPDEAWREITVAQGSLGAAHLPVQCPAGARPPGGASPARNCGPSGAGTWTAASPATTCPTLPRAQPWRLWPTWVGPDGALKRSSRLRRVTWGWTNTRPAAGQGGITT